jgi:ABC-2 type transport system ATP-binding protein
MVAETVLKARALVVRFKATTAVAGLDLEVQRGQVVGLIGPDGAGKTSSLRAFAGLLRPSQGEVDVLGLEAWKNRRALHQRLGYLAQRFALYGDLTVDENVEFFALLLGVKSWRARRDMLLDRVGLVPFRARQADRLSGGMKQKLALACSLMHAPEILLLDEPTTGVDPVTRREFWRLLADLVGEGLTLVIATPYLDEAERCTRVVLMHQAHVLVDASPREIPKLLPGVIVELAAEPRELVATALAGVPGVLDVRPFAARFHVHLESGAVTKQLRDALVQAGLTVSQAQEIPATLEDAFLYLTRSRITTSEAA